MQEHPAFGLEILQPITMWEDVLPMSTAITSAGTASGYPRGWPAREIALGARVVAVAEVFDVMTRQTPHGPRRTPEEALAELERCAGTQFDPAIVRCSWPSTAARAPADHAEPAAAPPSKLREHEQDVLLPLAQAAVEVGNHCVPKGT